MAKNWLDIIAFILVIVGAVNWGLVGLMGVDLVQTVAGSVSWLATTIYVLVGLSGVYMIYYAFKR